MRQEALCVDACLAAKWVIWEPDTPQALELLQQWESAGRRFVAPAFFWAEVGTILRKHAARGEANDAVARQHFQRLLMSSIVEEQVPWLRAYDIAQALGHLHLYDACYLALAEALDIEFWTADSSLHRSASSLFPWIRLLGIQTPP